jgi:hypothetical protein
VDSVFSSYWHAFRDASELSASIIPLRSQKYIDRRFVPMLATFASATASPSQKRSQMGGTGPGASTQPKTNGQLDAKTTDARIIAARFTRTPYAESRLSSTIVVGIERHLNYKSYAAITMGGAQGGSGGNFLAAAGVCHIELCALPSDFRYCARCADRSLCC